MGAYPMPVCFFRNSPHRFSLANHRVVQKGFPRLSSLAFVLRRGENVTPCLTDGTYHGHRPTAKENNAGRHLHHDSLIRPQRFHPGTANLTAASSASSTLKHAFDDGGDPFHVIQAHPRFARKLDKIGPHAFCSSQSPRGAAFKTGK
jgi:hypothetical protein